jgi:hypothetical protein
MKAARYGTIASSNPRLGRSSENRYLQAPQYAARSFVIVVAVWTRPAEQSVGCGLTRP